ncbi:hypothetical protein [Edaphocola aurantiacus]|nr:hypothetical protein [Edaphocola aurantiacus]
MENKNANIELLRVVIELIEKKKEELTIENIKSYYLKLSGALTYSI